MHFGLNAMPRLRDLLATDIESLGLWAFSIDWSSYDASMPNWLINAAFDIVEDLIDFSCYLSPDGEITKD